MNQLFDPIIDRSGTHSLKWGCGKDELPMWVADMDFLTAPEITAAIQKRAAHGIYGYTVLPDAWYDAIIGWWQSRHRFTIQKEWLLFSSGVVPTISSVIRKLTTPGENVLTMTPVYSIFFHLIRNNGRRVQECPLRDTDGGYRIDFADLEAKLSDPQTSLLLLCNPHNPTGNLWDRETLERIGTLCQKHHVVVLSDEIHCDLTDPGCEYVPFASVSETCAQNSITCISPTKTFNIAGLQTSAVAVPDGFLRHKVWRALNTDEIAGPNAFAVDAAVAAFTQGGEWLDQLRAYLLDNKTLVRSFIARELPQVTVTDSQATYLLWLDFRKFTDSAKELAGFLREKTGLWLSDGTPFHGRQQLRMNIACPRTRVEDGLQRLKTGVEAYRASLC